MMDAIKHGNYKNHAAETFFDDSLSSYSPETNDVYEESIILPRVGQQYQVEIPPLAREPYFFHLMPITHDDAIMPAIDPSLGIGLAIPVEWVQYAGDNISTKCEKDDSSDEGIVPGVAGLAHLQNTSSCPVDYNFSTLNACVLQNSNLDGILLQSTACKVTFDLLDQVNNVSFPANHKIKYNDQREFCVASLQKRKAVRFYPLPGSPTLSWSDSETQIFLLGLYIFGKNLVQLKKFMESKRMGDILSFYYGKFYRSDAHQRWSECRKIRSRSSIHGQRIFTGWRQQELLSRISNSASKEVQDILPEVSKTFNEGRATLEEFVFKLKAAVGLHVLVAAVGIGKGKHDLTGVTLDHVRTNQTIPLHPEIPVGRACSSLTSEDIVKFLTGDFRLSKAKSNDLFWEAVWPRLLARGWHSEQPKDCGSFGFKNALVFLVPGVKKFSRRKLVKGTHFFDSVSDVLSKVASDPGLLKLDFEGAKGSSSIKEENGRYVEDRLDQNGSSNHQHLCYLRPKLANSNSELMKFTVVDTSLVESEGSFMVREIRSLPSDATSNFGLSNSSEVCGNQGILEQEDFSDSSDDEEDSTLVSFGLKKPEDNHATRSEISKTSISLPNTVSIIGYSPDGTGKLQDNKIVEVKSQHSRRVRSSQTNCSAPSSKRRRLTACSRGIGGRTNPVPISHHQDKQLMDSKPDPLKAADSLVLEASLVQDKGNPRSKSTLENSKVENRRVGKANLPESKVQYRTLFDLNNLPPDADIAEPSSNELTTGEPSQSPAEKHQVGNQISLQASNGVPVDEQPSAPNRRQSTRNRPPTARALEALACGFLGTKRSWRPSNSTRRPSRKVRKTNVESVSVAAAEPSNIVESSTSSMSMAETVSKNHEVPARKGTHELLGVP